MITSPAFAGKSYAVLGLARSGLAAVEALAASGATIMAWDNRPEARLQVADKARLADPVTTSIYGYAGVVVSPGVPLNTHPIAERARAAKVPVIGDIELFAQARPTLPPHKVVGITGTNGKSTTTALIHHILKTADVPTMMGGNIGLPILGQDPLAPNENGVGVYVLELSSYQIDLTQSLDCDVSVLLNVTPDHLDRYDGVEDYAASKARLFAMQSPEHVAVIAAEDDYTRAIAGQLTGQRILVSSGDIKDQSRWPSLQGPHNAQNVAAAVAVARVLGISDEVIGRALVTYPGLPHRMERVAEKNGVLFVNDSKATNPTSTAPALAAYPAVHWILGGLPKGDDLDACEPHLGHVRAAYTIGEAGPMFARLLADKVPVKECEMLIEAVGVAAEAAQPGEVVLLSPACASFDQFRDYEARGDAFRAAVEALA
ncbi:MAG: UDP-N-acetylmuramoylalanine--D-glutamate ligase [uncultured Sphingosinicella sp.]|uniref:UDP-N-acetylmuramoylalanine--D-glutamate ligase n=1 Tax=uncultured Sphingosinicella sp. TaxID=478748 RepID=A0A6J4U8F6_9SPHN|nr:UDP-N-acetylmuramoyl-L-alanine--D-glutamate ligase [uncultured Sphingosinicella sp.]CAA9543145.1 MAG: UDP-N-acetylmuramoylalanine--D-glutamate ligase [uncultured Sphingosinicella sp.]